MIGNALGGLLAPQTPGGGLLDPRKAMLMQFFANVGNSVAGRHSNSSPMDAYMRATMLQQQNARIQQENELRRMQIDQLKTKMQREAERRAMVSRAMGGAEQMGPPTPGGAMQAQPLPGMNAGDVGKVNMGLLQQVAWADDPAGMAKAYLSSQQIKPTSAMQNFEYLLSQGVTPAQAIDRAFSGGTNVSVNMPDPNAGWDKFSDNQGKALIEYPNKMQELFGDQANALENMKRMRELNREMSEDPRVFGQGETRNMFNQRLRSVGLPELGDTSTGEEYAARSGVMVADELRKNTGVQTEGDRVYTKQYMAGLDNDPVARQKILDWSIAKSALRQDQLREAQRINMANSLPEARKMYMASQESINRIPAVKNGVMYDTFVADAISDGLSREEAYAQWKELFK